MAKARKAASSKASITSKGHIVPCGPFRETIALPSKTIIHNGLRDLFERQRIGTAELAAATRWLNDFELGCERAVNPEASGSGGGGGYDGYSIACIDALSRYGEAARAVGLFGDMLLRTFVAGGLSLRAIERKLAESQDQQTEARQARELLRAALESNVDQVLDTLVKRGDVGAIAAKYYRRMIGDGMPTWRMLEVLLEDLSRPEQPIMSGRDLSGALVATLLRLTEHYSEIDNSRKRLPSFEISRIRSERRAAV